MLELSYCYKMLASTIHKPNPTHTNANINTIGAAARRGIEPTNQDHPTIR